ncbi:MAG: RdgB/HAM1 family non-canonical purine NTP pyrophosphatase [Thaumarchaeota archaeon]|nr:RdgB/HAM1 family non-canonical purine NTP pyrophosphatase [Nitrososphaerota archaeon]
MRGSSEPSGESVVFATSNRGKLEEARAILAPFEISVEGYDGKGIEIQADTTSEIASYASRGASKAAGRAVLVEDAGLYVESLNGFPGPYSAYAFKTIGVAGIIALLRPSPRRRAAKFVSSLAYCEPLGEPTLFEGSVQGAIATRPRGTRGFGFDPIFVPVGGRKTFGELTIQEKSAVSHRADSMKKFAKWYLSRERR